jgi:hypothetical protein
MLATLPYTRFQLTLVAWLRSQGPNTSFFTVTAGPSATLVANGTTLVRITSLLDVAAAKTKLPTLQRAIHAFTCMNGRSERAVEEFRLEKHSSHTIRSIATVGTERYKPAMPPT